MFRMNLSGVSRIKHLGIMLLLENNQRLVEVKMKWRCSFVWVLFLLHHRGLMTVSFFFLFCFYRMTQHDFFLSVYSSL